MAVFAFEASRGDSAFVTSVIRGLWVGELNESSDSLVENRTGLTDVKCTSFVSSEVELILAFGVCASLTNFSHVFLDGYLHSSILNALESS